MADTTNTTTTMTMSTKFSPKVPRPWLTDDANAKYQEAEEILLNTVTDSLWYQNITAVGSKDIKKAAFTYNNYPMYADLEK